MIRGFYPFITMTVKQAVKCKASSCWVLDGVIAVETRHNSLPAAERNFYQQCVAKGNRFIWFFFVFSTALKDPAKVRQEQDLVTGETRILDINKRRYIMHRRLFILQKILSPLPKCYRITRNFFVIVIPFALK